jgi:hypothetical protein
MAKAFLTVIPPKPGEYTCSPGAADYQAIGEFITACSLIEVNMHVVLRHWLSVEEQIARTLLGEARFKDLIRFLRFAFEIQTRFNPTDELRNTFELLYKQFEYINNIRAVIAHKPCFTDGIGLMFHNSLTADKEEKLFRYICSSKQLRNCAQFGLVVANVLRQTTTGWIKNQEIYIQHCDEQLASFGKLDLPDPPPGTTRQTAKQKRRRPSSPA